MQFILFSSRIIFCKFYQVSTCKHGFKIIVRSVILKPCSYQSIKCLKSCKLQRKNSEPVFEVLTQYFSQCGIISFYLPFLPQLLAFKLFKLPECYHVSGLRKNERLCYCFGFNKFLEIP